MRLLRSASVPSSLWRCISAVLDPSCWQGDDGGVVVRGELASALVGPVVIEVARVVAKDRGQQAVGLGFEEGAPFVPCVAGAGCGAESCGAEHSAYGCCADLVAEASQFAVHAAESPVGVLCSKPEDEVADFLRQGRASW
jgi:hypothetical protein